MNTRAADGTEGTDQINTRAADGTKGTDLLKGLIKQVCAFCAFCGPGDQEDLSFPSPTSTLVPPTRTREISPPAISILMWMRLGRPIFTPCALTIDPACAAGTRPCFTR